ncbi:ceramidase domain-containing protein [Salinibacterium sp. G-O1]|uniref:ceramidase domain-containing protein n=1 Tax=Salinibacterium sp. G-O1 TaxID=3046208 RepID=UPI0024B91D50|nr:ceramidase domain-containing protein [Salinibacterium sp. G-O1]MDJ0336138.1 ceramidase domain-containing protein [Salinibacterium sp. G-O1]
MTPGALSPVARVVVALAGGIALSVLIYLLALWLDVSTLAERPATCTETGCFCEAPLGVVPMQFANSVSSLGFVFLGVWTLVAARRPAVGSPERRLTPLFGAALVFIGASSFLYHSTLSFFGQFLDIFSMYIFGILLALGALYRSGRLGARTALALFITLSLSMAVVQFLVPDARRVLFVVLLLPGIVLELMPFVTGSRPRSRHVRFIWIGVAAMVVAYVIWILDQTTFFCSAQSPIQGHAIWHLLGAVAAVMIVAHYRDTQHGASPG